MAHLVELHDEGSRPIPGIGDQPDASVESLGMLVSLVVDLEAHWHGLDEAPRIAGLRRIEGVAASLQLRAGSPASPARPVPLVGLSLRERQVLGLLIEGVSTSGMAARLGISTATIRSHVKSLLSKLGVHSRIEAVALIRSTEARRPWPQDADPEVNPPVTAVPP